MMAASLSGNTPDSPHHPGLLARTPSATAQQRALLTAAALLDLAWLGFLASLVWMR